ncbi:MAG: hypothetical protein IJP69_01495 [Synergistaceae bacterium]|nr:hypothetical protein [Synergistaceae bacterium]
MSKINKNTCGTQEIFCPNAFGEDVRREHERKCYNADLDELGSPRFYKRGFLELTGSSRILLCHYNNVKY